ncbi:hypothetical protein [Mucilaginibacter segetis]|uniref:Lipocalin-like domain-containing protein n=1 Tax=Mucilaginibacter segetis TaxID=2793071 RepID=A0A934UKV5_9SPHI|nr:hypothetical protein [Mucilaginibacter segetis]MBK0377709.1 hypothetical protein [Mucilaginibacter segetis]
MKTTIRLLPLILLSFISCNNSIQREGLYGKWKYIKVEHPHISPSDTISSADIAEQAPYIVFETNDSLKIIWGGKLLSYGTFGTQGQNIKYKEVLPDGKTREFPFYVSVLTDNKMVFETMGDEGAKITAVKATNEHP